MFSSKDEIVVALGLIFGSQWAQPLAQGGAAVVECRFWRWCSIHGTQNSYFFKELVALCPSADTKYSRVKIKFSIQNASCNPSCVNMGTNHPQADSIQIQGCALRMEVLMWIQMSFALWHKSWKKWEYETHCSERTHEISRQPVIAMWFSSAEILCQNSRV